MNNSTIYIVNRKRILERFIQLIIFIATVIAIYNFLRYYFNPNYKLSYASIIGYLIVLIWISLTDVSVRKLEFRDEEKELLISKKSFFGKEQNHIIPYSKLEYEVKSFNKFWDYLFQKKSLTLLNANIEIVKIRSNDGFNKKEIEKIIKFLMEIKTPINLL